MNIQLSQNYLLKQIFSPATLNFLGNLVEKSADH
jgi:hypothetical protein